MAFYDESFNAVELAIKNTKVSSDSPIIFIDVHDTGNRILGRRLEFDTWRDVGFMPKVAIANAPDEETGKDQLGTAPGSFITAFKKKLADKLGIQEEEVSINKPYQGGNVVRFFGNPYHNRKLRRILKGRKIIAVQLEFDRGMYLDEVSQKPILWKIQSVKNSLMATLKEMENFNFSEIDELE